MQYVDSVFPFITSYLHKNGKKLGTELKETRIVEKLVATIPFHHRKTKSK